MPHPIYAGSQIKFFYTDDFGQDRLVTLKDYIGDAGSLMRYDPAIHKHSIGSGRIEVIRKVEEVEYGVKGAAERRRAVRDRKNWRVRQADITEASTKEGRNKSLMRTTTFIA